MWINYLRRPCTENCKLHQRTMKVILLVGACGSGKTWVMSKLIKTLKLDQLGAIGMFCYHRNDQVAVLGKYDGSTFQGSDRLSMAVMRDLPKFKKECKMAYVICEGDRFTNSTFIDGLKPYIIRIVDDGKKGRAKRKSKQTERQIKSINTRVSKITPNTEVLNSEVAYKIIMQKITSL